MTFQIVVVIGEGASQLRLAQARVTEQLLDGSRSDGEDRSIERACRSDRTSGWMGTCQVISAGGRSWLTGRELGTPGHRRGLSLL